MSEYQYYEFVALDRGALTKAEMQELRGVSSRADISSTRFVNVYNYGDFRGDPYHFMTRYFDAMVYVANWGTHRLMLRLPADLVDRTLLQTYCPGESASLRIKDNAIVVDFCSQLEDFAEKRANYLDDLAQREHAVWQHVEELVALKQSKAYAEAVGLLKDLQELNLRKEKVSEFKQRGDDLCRRHQKKKTFIERMKQAGLP